MSAERPDPRLRAVAVTSGYSEVPVIHEISAGVGPGEVASIVGPNGSGKSTFLKSLVGVIPVRSGSVWLSDQEITNRAPEEIARGGVGYVPQTDDIFEPLTVKENLQIGGYLLRSREVAERIGTVVETFPALGPMLGRRAGKLSGGERKMLAIGRVLMLRPTVFLLDEPTANLAPAVAVSLLRDHVQRLAGSGAAVLLIEQRARTALEISDWTYVLGGGRVVLEGRPAELASRQDFVESFLGGRRDRPQLTNHGPFVGRRPERE